MTRHQACVRKDMKGRHFNSAEAAGRALGASSRRCAKGGGRRRRR